MALSKYMLDQSCSCEAHAITDNFFLEAKEKMGDLRRARYMARYFLSTL